MNNCNLSTAIFSALVLFSGSQQNANQNANFYEEVLKIDGKMINSGRIKATTTKKAIGSGTIENIFTFKETDGNVKLFSPSFSENITIDGPNLTSKIEDLGEFLGENSLSISENVQCDLTYTSEEGNKVPKPEYIPLSGNDTTLTVIVGLKNPSDGIDLEIRKNVTLSGNNSELLSNTRLATGAKVIISSAYAFPRGNIKAVSGSSMTFLDAYTLKSGVIWDFSSGAELKGESAIVLDKGSALKL